MEQKGPKFNNTSRAPKPEINVIDLRNKGIAGELLTNKEKKIVRDMGWKVMPGWAWNPLLKYPANFSCFCGRGAKFKKCCINNVPKSCKEEDVEKYQSVVDAALAGITPRVKIEFMNPIKKETTDDINASKDI